MKNNKILILGISGMLGSCLFKYLSQEIKYITYGTLRDKEGMNHFSTLCAPNIYHNVNIENADSLLDVMFKIRPNIVINCIGVIKQLPEAANPLISLPINSIFPHQLAKYCQMFDSRLIHVSTDCVFSGLKGNYKEFDKPDALDLYGLSKLLGEVDYPNTITIRTSIIGHELMGSRSLVDWFLSQRNEVFGYRKAIFSGLPTVEIAKILSNFIIPNEKLCGLYHLSSDPISKFDLLNLIAERYSNKISIVPDDTLIIDRSLNSDKFRNATGYKPAEWFELINSMYIFNKDMV